MSVMRWAVVLVSVGLAGGCASTAGGGKPAAAKYPEAENITTWPDDYPLPDGQEIGIAELGRTETSSVHLVQVRHRESTHVHQSHDLIAVLIRGHGILHLGDRTFSMREGSVVAIPHGVPHAFVNESHRPAAAFVVFTPPFDGKDTVPVTE